MLKLLVRDAFRKALANVLPGKLSTCGNQISPLAIGDGVLLVDSTCVRWSTFFFVNLNATAQTVQCTSALAFAALRSASSSRHDAVFGVFCLFSPLEGLAAEGHCYLLVNARSRAATASFAVQFFALQSCAVQCASSTRAAAMASFRFGRCRYIFMRIAEQRTAYRGCNSARICHFASSPAAIRVSNGHRGTAPTACYWRTRRRGGSAGVNMGVARRPYANPSLRLDGLQLRLGRKMG